jgi:hypothetical protein
VTVGTALLSLPVATRSGQRAEVVDALFTATSSVCLTGRHPPRPAQHRHLQPGSETMVAIIWSPGSR